MTQEISDYRWVEVTADAAFAPRDGAGALVHNGKMFLIGGWNPGDKVNFPRICNNEVWCSEDGGHWELVKPNTFKDDSFDGSSAWEGRHAAGYVVHDGKMWIVGGDPNQGHYQYDVWNSSDGAEWHRVNGDKPVPWGPRALHCAYVLDGRIWVLGGQTMPHFAPSPTTVFYEDVWCTPDGVDWTRIVPRKPAWAPRAMTGASLVFQDKLWILGGGTYDTPDFPGRKYYNDVWCSSDGENWEEVTRAAPWEPREFHDVAVFDGRMWVMEGFDGQNRNDVWYSADGVNWVELPDTPWKPRHAASVFVYDDALWMVAGNNMQSDVWKLVRGSSGSG